MLRKILLAASTLAVFSISSVAYAGAAKVTLCHVTGSASNPYVLISVASQALPAHVAHGDFVFPQFPGAADCSSIPPDDGGGTGGPQN